MKKKTFGAFTALSLLGLGLSVIAGCKAATPVGTITLEASAQEFWANHEYTITAKFEGENFDLDKAAVAFEVPQEIVQFGVEGNTLSFVTGDSWAKDVTVKATLYVDADQTTALASAEVKFDIHKEEESIELANEKTAFSQGDHFDLGELEVSYVRVLDGAEAERKSVSRDDLLVELDGAEVSDNYVFEDLEEHSVRVTYEAKNLSAEYTVVAAENKVWQLMQFAAPAKEQATFTAVLSSDYGNDYEEYQYGEGFFLDNSAQYVPQMYRQEFYQDQEFVWHYIAEEVEEQQEAEPAGRLKRDEAGNAEDGEPAEDTAAEETQYAFADLSYVKADMGYKPMTFDAFMADKKDCTLAELNLDAFASLEYVADAEAEEGVFTFKEKAEFEGAKLSDYFKAKIGAEDLDTEFELTWDTNQGKIVIGMSSADNFTYIAEIELETELADTFNALLDETEDFEADKYSPFVQYAVDPVGAGNGYMTTNHEASGEGIEGIWTSTAYNAIQVYEGHGAGGFAQSLGLYAIASGRDYFNGSYFFGWEAIPEKTWVYGADIVSQGVYDYDVWGGTPSFSAATGNHYNLFKYLPGFLAKGTYGITTSQADLWNFEGITPYGNNIYELDYTIYGGMDLTYSDGTKVHEDALTWLDDASTINSDVFKHSDYYAYRMDMAMFFEISETGVTLYYCDIAIYGNERDNFDAGIIQNDGLVDQWTLYPESFDEMFKSFAEDNLTPYVTGTAISAPESVSMTLGDEPLQLDVKVVDATGAQATESSLSYQVIEGDTVIQVSEDGKVTALAAGDAKIKVTDAVTGLEAVINVTVAAAPSGDDSGDDNGEGGNDPINPENIKAAEAAKNSKLAANFELLRF